VGLIYSGWPVNTSRITTDDGHTLNRKLKR
jgi:hypothetical protein